MVWLCLNNVKLGLDWLGFIGFDLELYSLYMCTVYCSLTKIFKVRIERGKKWKLHFYREIYC